MTGPTGPAPDVLPYFDTYLDAVVRGDRRTAIDTALDMHEHAVPAEEVITRLLAPAQVEVGRGWQESRWGVGVEHRATSITEAALHAVAAAEVALGRTPPEGSTGRAVIACAEGEWHWLPPLMLAEIARLRGLEVSFAGPSMPATEMAGFLGADPPAAVAVSCSLAASLPGAWRVVTQVRALGMTVVAGGRGFGPSGRWGGPLGVDAWAATLTDGADLLVAAQSRPSPGPRSSPVPDDRTEEVRHLARIADSVVAAAVAEAIGAWPAMMERDAALAATRHDLQATLATVTGAVLVGDEQVVLDFVHWFEAVLRARGLPVAFVATSFELLGHQTPTGLPQTSRMLGTGLTACSANPLPRR